VVAGVFAAASLVLMPRLFFHGHLTALDIPVAFAWLLTVYIFWRWTASQRPRLWLTVLLLGLSYGLALGTKNTSFVLPLVFLLWILLFRRTREAFLLLFGMLLIGGLVFFATWPWLYVDPVGHLREYLRLVTVGHWDISQYYLGQLHARAPWHYPFVTLIATVPVAISLLALLGIIRVAVAGRTDTGGWLVIMNVAIPLFFFAFVASQAYGGERLFLIVFPFVALLAGLGFDCLWEEITGLEGRRRVAATVLAILLLLPGLAGIALLHPYQLSYFSEIVGGLKGAERLGFELTYWCETYDGMLSYLNKVPENSPSVWTEEDGVLYAYQNEGLLRPDIQVGGRVVKAGPLAATYALIQRRPSGYTPEIESILRDRQPVFVVRQGETPLAYLYKIQ